MSTPDFDVVVVGARVAGASTAMLLARAGARVLVLDRSAYGSDSTEWPAAAETKSSTQSVAVWAGSGVPESLASVPSPPSVPSSPSDPSGSGGGTSSIGGFPLLIDNAASITAGSTTQLSVAPGGAVEPKSRSRRSRPSSARVLSHSSGYLSRPSKDRTWTS